ncbi:glycosyltransferase family 39 protein [Halorientalis pallida]|uniref:glycosyltransferase family 39 protein n=1 Tax=Halorientalis pallida TaxID=2479928 RepID=UPI00187D1B14|nr:glycosyltransferase family 39 protein [Halorientalis pallida]
MGGHIDWRDRYVIALAGVVLLGAALRLYGLGVESIWVDEAITLRFVRNHGPLELLWVIPSKQPHLPPYYVFLDVWVALVGTSATAVRFPSAVFGILSLPVLYLLGRDLFDRPTGLVATLVFAVAPFQLYYAQETRMYSLWTVLTLCSFLAFLWLRRRPTRRLAAGYVVATLSTAAVHPFGLFVVVTQGLVLLVDNLLAGDGIEIGELTALERAQAACWALLAPILVVGVLKLESAVAGFNFISPPGPGRVAGTVVEYFTTASGTAALAVAALVAVGVALALRSRPFGRERRLLIVWALVPVLGLVAVSYLVTPLFWERYTITATPAWVLLAARGFTSLGRGGLGLGLERRHLGYALAGLLVVGILPATVHYHTTDGKEQWDEAVPDLEAAAESDDLVLVIDRAGLSAFEYYRTRSDLTVQPIHAGWRANGSYVTPNATVRNRTAGHDRVWLVLTHLWFLSGERQRMLDVASDGRQVVRHREYESVEVYLLENRTQRQS